MAGNRVLTFQGPMKLEETIDYPKLADPEAGKLSTARSSRS